MAVRSSDHPSQEGEGPVPTELQAEIATLRRSTDLLYEEALKAAKSTDE